MSDLVVNLTARGRESHNLALFPCTVTGSWIDLEYPHEPRFHPKHPGYMYGKGHAWRGGGHAWVAGGVGGRGACVAGETATAAGGKHPTRMHSC